MPCGNGYKRDCTRKVCLLRHIDDSDDRSTNDNHLQTVQSDDEKLMEMAIKKSLETQKMSCQWCKEMIVMSTPDELILHQINQCPMIENREERPINKQKNENKEQNTGKSMQRKQYPTRRTTFAEETIMQTTNTAKEDTMTKLETSTVTKKENEESMSDEYGNNTVLADQVDEDEELKEVQLANQEDEDEELKEVQFELQETPIVIEVKTPEKQNVGYDNNTITEIKELEENLDDISIEETS